MRKVQVIEQDGKRAGTAATLRKLDHRIDSAARGRC